MMAANKITPAKMQTQNFEVNQLQSNILTAFASLSNQVVNTPSDGQFLTDLDFLTGDNTTQHKLGVSPTGYIVISQSAAANFYLVSKTSNTITLNASAPATVSIFVF